MFLNMDVLQGGVVSTSPNPQAGGPPLVGCPRMLIQFIRSYPPYRRPFLYPQPENVPCCGDRDPLYMVWIIVPFIITRIVLKVSVITDLIKRQMRRSNINMTWLNFDGLSCRFSISTGLETHKYVHMICVTVYTTNSHPSVEWRHRKIPHYRSENALPDQLKRRETSSEFLRHSSHLRQEIYNTMFVWPCAISTTM